MRYEIAWMKFHAKRPKCIGVITIMSISRDIDMELATLIYKQTKNENFTRNICMFMDSDEQKKVLVRFIKEYNPTLTEINHRSFEIVMDKPALHTCD